MRRIIGWALAALIAIAIVIAGIQSASEPDTVRPLYPTSSSRPTTSAPATSGVHPPRFCKDTDRRNIPYGDRDYATWLDGDKDGIACEIPPPKRGR